jgi:site-specific DNA recombinase
MSVTPLPTTIDACRNLLTYARTSSERLLGLFGQDTEIQDWAEREGYEIVGHAHDAHVHSQSQVDDRKGLMAVVEAIESRRADGVVVYHLDRLARDWYIQDDAIHRIWGAGGHVFSTDYGEWKPDKPGEAQWHLRKKYAEIAEAEYHALLARLQDGRRRKMARGGYGGGHRYARRYGVELVEIQGKLEYRPIPREQDVIRRIVAGCPNGAGYREMARTLNAEGIPTATGAQWKAHVVRRLALRGPDRPMMVVDETTAAQPLQWIKEAAS